MSSNFSTKIMTHHKVNKTLEEIGLNESEVLTYRAALALGPTNIKSLAQATEIKRTTMYTVVEGLLAKGLLHREMQGLKYVFVAESPQRLEDLYESRRAALKGCISELISLQRFGNTDNAVRNFEGKQAIRGAYNRILEDCEQGKDYLIISNQEKWHGMDAEFFQSYMEKRARMNMFVRYLLVDSPLARQHQKLQSNYHARIKLLPSEIKFDANVVIIPRRIMITQLVAPIFAMTIDNKNIVSTFSHLFNIIWSVIPDSARSTK